MAQKTAKPKPGESAAYQELLGFSGGKPSIDKVKDANTNPAHKLTGNETVTVDDGVIDSSANPPQHYYWITGTKNPYYFVKVIDVNLT